jgi:hypothetical protein
MKIPACNGAGNQSICDILFSWFALNDKMGFLDNSIYIVFKEELNYACRATTEQAGF